MNIDLNKAVNMKYKQSVESIEEDKNIHHSPRAANQREGEIYERSNLERTHRCQVFADESHDSVSSSAKNKTKKRRRTCKQFG